MQQHSYDCNSKVKHYIGNTFFVSIEILVRIFLSRIHITLIRFLYHICDVVLKF